jgi:hypothetical protein
LRRPRSRWGSSKGSSRGAYRLIDAPSRADGSLQEEGGMRAAIVVTVLRPWRWRSFPSPELPCPVGEWTRPWKKFATAAGRPPGAVHRHRSGDILLFVFLLAGTAGGFAGAISSGNCSAKGRSK